MKRATSVALLLSSSIVSSACATEPAPAPAGDPQTVFFTRLFPLPGQVGLFVANADGSGERSLFDTPAPAYNPTWSPDGEWLAFTSEREGSADLYRARPDGTGLERLTDNPAYDDQAAFSPDGDRIVFVSTRGAGTSDLWLLDLATRQSQVLTSGDGGDFRPAWSPDGAWIAFSSDRGHGLPFAHGRWEAVHLVDIYLIHPDGTGLRQLPTPGEFCGSPTWSEDSRRLLVYCMSREDTLTYRRSVVDDGNTRIVAIDIATGTPTDVAASPGVKMAPAFLPGGEIAFIRKDAKGAGIHYASGADGPRGDLRGAAWSPDGSRVAYHRRMPGPTQIGVLEDAVWSRLDGFELRLTGDQPSFDPSGARYAVVTYVPPPATNELIVVGSGGQYPQVLFHDEHRSVLGPQWSTGGDRLVFGIGPFGAFFNGFHDRFVNEEDRVNGGAQVATIDADGSGFHELTSGPNNNAFPSLAPDGRQLVYRTFGPEGNGLRVLHLDSGTVTTLTTGYDNFPLWSPRGDLIMFSRLDGGSYEIFTIRPDGTDERRLTSAPGNDAHQGWSPDGEQIVFASGRMGFKDEVLYTDAPQPYGELFVMRADGTDVRQLTDNQWEDGTPAWQPSMPVPQER
jgi:Tol biopolymer transport system component